MPPKISTSTAPGPAATMKNQYLIAYNAVSATLWFGVLARVLLCAATQGVQNGAVYGELERYTRLVQTGAGLEVLHSLLGTSHVSSLSHKKEKTGGVHGHVLTCNVKGLSAHRCSRPRCKSLAAFS